MFKIRRERWKGFNKYVKEFHKRKERIHREKIDRIQREKINLLKINDVEGYLRMVQVSFGLQAVSAPSFPTYLFLLDIILDILQDAKSDRVKQLLKETEKYLQKLGSKLKDAKVMTNRFENDMDEVRTAIVDENDTSIENEDEAKASLFLVNFLELLPLFCFSQDFNHHHHHLFFFKILKFSYHQCALQHYMESNEKYYLMAHRYQHCSCSIFFYY